MADVHESQAETHSGASWHTRTPQRSLPIEATLVAAREYLSRRGDVDAAYLFGSVAQGRTRPDSDVDVAVLFPPELSRQAVLAARLQIAGALSVRLRREVDVVPLNRASPLLGFQVVKYGRLILERDPRRRQEFELRALARYYDARPYVTLRTAELLRRIRQESTSGGSRRDRDALEQARRLSARLAALSADPAA